jgi:hypothetical protein
MRNTKNYKQETKFIGFSLEEQYVDQLRKLAKSMNTSLACLIRTLIMYYIENDLLPEPSQIAQEEEEALLEDFEEMDLTR